MPKARSTDAEPAPKPARLPGPGKEAAPPKAPPKRPKMGKAGRPDVVPLDEHLAALLNPALNDGRRSSAVPDRSALRGADGFAEAPQAQFVSAEPIPVGTLVAPPAGKGRKTETPAEHPRGLSGAAATAEVLQQLLQSGDPRLKAQAWVPHRPARPDKSEGGITFKLSSEYEPKGDQPNAIAELVDGVQRQERDQVLLGVTGSGKTFTMAQVIAATNRPALILAPNKTLAAQLYGEFKSFFPDNAVEYFVSYYDYYQPEAYVPRSDTYIEKESTINEQIDRMRHAATRSLLERDDVIIVASVSCIYGIGSVETYTAMTFGVSVGEKHRPAPAHRRSRGAAIQAHARFQPRHVSGCAAIPSSSSRPITRTAAGASASSATRSKASRNSIRSPARRPTTSSSPRSMRIPITSRPRPTLIQSVKAIKDELKGRLDQLYAQGRLLEAQRLEQRTNFDLEMLEATGVLPGHRELFALPHRAASPASRRRRCSNTCPTTRSSSPTRATSRCRRSAACTRATFRRKATLAEYGFRLPSCLDNRPLRFEEWDAMRPQTVHVSATPGPWEIERAQGVFVEQVIRPTGLIDPPVEVRPARTQVDDVLGEIRDHGRAGRLPHLGHRADQAHGRGPDRIPA